MSEKKTSKRSAPISYRPPQHLRGELAARHLKSGLSLNAFITEAIFSKPAPRQVKRPPVEKADLAKVLALAGQIRDELMANQQLLSEEKLEQALDDLSVLRSAIFTALGFKP